MKKTKNKELLDLFSEKLYLISQDPYIGESKKGPLKDYKTVKFVFKRVDYRILYSINENEIKIFIRRLGIRENFYDNL